MKSQILIAEDNVSILTGIVDYLNAEGFGTTTATNGRQALEKYHQESPDLIILDIMMPELSGYDVCQEIRRSDQLTKIIMLTAKGDETDKVVGLEMGADDYIVKPFSLKELSARIRAVLRRNGTETKPDRPSSLEFGDVRIDTQTLVGYRGDNSFPVSIREIELLQYFLNNEGRALDRNQILEDIWGIHYGGTTRTLDQHIAKLRQKIERSPQDPQHIITVHRVGYRFVRSP